METLELLEELLSDYPGTLLLVSHDRRFIDNTVTGCWLFEGDGRISDYVGGYADMMATREQQNAQQQAKSAPVKAPGAGRCRRARSAEEKQEALLQAAA